MPEIQERHLYSTVIFTDSNVYRFAKEDFFWRIEKRRLWDGRHHIGEK